MATVVIIHAADDTLPARALSDRLRQSPLSVAIEKPPGPELQKLIEMADVVVALWSPRSVAQADLVQEVKNAPNQKVVHACMQNAAVPSAFRGAKAINLTGWRGEESFPAWLELGKLVTSRAGVAFMGPPPTTAGGFFQPGNAAAAAAGAAQTKTAPKRAAAQPARPQSAPPQRQPAPPQRAASQRDHAPPPEEKRGGGMMIAIIAVVVIAALGGGGYWWWSQQQGAHAASTAWESVDRNDPAALRAFIAAQSGPLKTQAQGALSELEERSFEAASDTDTVEALQGFLRDFPQSQHALAARGRIAELQANATSGTTATVTTTATTTTTDQLNPDLNPPGSTAATTTPAPASGGPAPLTPPSNESGTAQEPPSAPSTTP